MQWSMLLSTEEAFGRDFLEETRGGKSESDKLSNIKHFTGLSLFVYFLTLS